MVFDNPGAAVDKETIDSILEYYFQNPPSQFSAYLTPVACKRVKLFLDFMTQDISLALGESNSKVKQTFKI